MSDNETWSIDRVSNKEIFWKKYAENVHQKLVPDSFLVLASSPKEAMHACK